MSSATIQMSRKDRTGMSVNELLPLARIVICSDVRRQQISRIDSFSSQINLESLLKWILPVKRSSFTL